QEDLEDESDIRKVETSEEDKSPEMQIEIDEEKAMEHGLTPGEIAQSVDDITRGQTATSIESESDGVFDVIVQYSAQDFDNEGEYIDLQDLANIEEGEGPTVINRLDQEPSVEFTVTYSSDTNLNEVHQVIEDVIDDVDLEDGTTYSFGGEQELLDDSIQSLAF